MQISLPAYANQPTSRGRLFSHPFRLRLLLWVFLFCQDNRLHHRRSSKVNKLIAFPSSHELEDKLEFKKFYCGHYHEELGLDEKHEILYKAIKPLG